MPRFYAAWTRGILRFPLLVVLAVTLLSIAAGWYTAVNLSIDTSTTNMISAKTPFRRHAINYDKAFPQFTDSIAIVIDAPSSDAAVTMANDLAQRLGKDKKLFTRVEYPADDPFFKKNGLLYLDTPELTALSDRLASAEPFLATLAQQPDLSGLFHILTLALKEGGDATGTKEFAALVGHAASVTEAQAQNRPAMLAWRDLLDTGGENGTRQIVVAYPDLSRGGFSPGEAALAAVRRTVSDIHDDRLQGTTVRLTGSVAIDDAELQSVVVGGEKAGLLSLGLVVLLMIIGLRSVRLIVPALVTLAFGLVWTAAFAALAIGHLNLISVAFAILFIGLGVDFSIHYCLYYQERLADRPREALPLTGAGVGGSLAISTLCAAAGFLSFMPTDYKGLAELGLISGGGMVIAFFLNMTLLPAMLAMLPGKPGRQPPAAGPAEPFTRRYYRPILIVTAVCGLVAAAALPFSRFDFDPMALKDPHSESVATFYDLAKDPRNGVYAIDVLAPDLAKAKQEAARLQKLPEVGDTVTLYSLVPEDQDEKLNIIEQLSFFLAPALAPGPTAPFDPAAAVPAIQDFRHAAATYLSSHRDGPFAAAVTRFDKALAALDLSKPDVVTALNRRLTGFLPAMLDDLRLALQAEPVSIDDIPARIRNSWVAADGQARIQLQPASPIKTNADFRRFATAALAAAPNAVGTPITISEAGRAVVTAFGEASAIAFVVVAIILIVLLRSLSGLLLVMLPMILAAILTGGTTVAFDLPFNFANIIVLPLLFGLGVASGVHMVMRRRHRSSTSDVMHTSTPRAVLFSALTTIASFGSLALSGHLGMTSMGLLLTIAIGYTLLCMLVVLPALMTWVDRRSA